MSGSLKQHAPAISLGAEHIGGLFGYAMVLTRNRTDAEDLVQETYVRALEAVGRLREDSNIKGWLFTILRNLWLNELRRRRSSPTFVEVDGDDTSVDKLPGKDKNADELFVSNEHSIAVQTAINSLPLEFKEILILREFQELSYQEIATVLGCPAGTVMSRLGRARAKLRILLKDAWTPGQRSRAIS